MNDILAIETNMLSKSYREVEAVRSVNLAIQSYQITAFLGLNGEGKTTTIKMLLGMVEPTSGKGQVLGEQINDDAANIPLRRRVAYVSENKPLYEYMTVDQMIQFTRSFYSDWRVDVEQELKKSYQLSAVGISSLSLRG
jgi:ABC-2 type transport system ATP-binding protein